MTTADRDEHLQRLLLGLLPASGAAVGNGHLQALWLQAVTHASLQASQEEFNGLREALVASGLAVRGKGRGGSTARAVAAAPASEGFALESEVANVDVDASDAGQGATARKPASGKSARGNPASGNSASGKAKTRAAAAGEDAQVLSYRHSDRRKNNPEVGLVNEASDPQQPKQVWAYNPHLDPVLNFDSARAELENLIDDALASGDADAARAALQEIKRRGAPYLQWAGKAERTSFEVDTVSLHVHERIDPMSILSAVRKQMEDAKAGRIKGEEPPALGRQASLFEAPFESLPLRNAVDFYRHDKGWANRLVAGDSLQVMNSLLVKEGMAGQVQMIYIDPPYGIKYGSNFQPFVGKRDVKDRSDADLTQEPEMIKAFRDTWELGVHSYLAYLRDRILLAKNLIAETGSVFVQISDENLHHVREIMDEVLGPHNFCSVITFAKTSGQTDNLLASVSDYIVWYAKDKKQVKYRQLYLEKDLNGAGGGEYRKVLLPSGAKRPLKDEEATGSAEIASGAKVYRLDNLTSQSPGTRYDVPHLGKVFFPIGYWKTEAAAMPRLLRAGRAEARSSSLAYVRCFDDFPVFSLNSTWGDTAIAGRPGDKTYVVQTGPKVIERCVLMTTDPGDLVLDPTCGSGTTAFVAEMGSVSV